MNAQRLFRPGFCQLRKIPSNSSLTISLGPTLITQSAMAQQTAMRCQEKREKRASGPVERFDEADRSRFCVLEG